MFNKKLALLLSIIAIFVTACTGTIPVSESNQADDADDQEAVPGAEEAAAEESPADEAPAEEAAIESASEENQSEASAETSETDGPLAKNGKPLLDDEPRFPYESYWTTDFSLHTVPYSEILSGGPPRDGIPPIDSPSFVSVADADEWLSDTEPVFVVSINEDTRAYPLQIMTWHEIVNDTIGDVPVSVTFCPLCNSAITFERTLGDTVLDFGVSGKLRNSDLIMWDRQTQSWWQQLTGESIVGELVGEQLTFIPTQLVSWANFKENFSAGQVLSKETGFSRPYGQNPYSGYDSNQSPFLFSGTPDSRLAAVDRIVAVDLNEELVAYPYNVLAEENVVADTVGGENVVVFWEAGTTSALDKSSIANSRDVGAAAVYSPILEDQELTFTWDGTSFVDDQTQSRWNIFGKATDGELAGEQLTPINHANHFWFAWAAFRPDTRIYSPS